MAIRLDRATITQPTDDELVMAWRAGDASALDTLLERHRGLVRVKARSYFLVGADFDDVEQEGLIGLYEAVCDFRPACGVAFRAFADLCITRQILSAVKAASRRKHEPLNQYVSLSSETETDDPVGQMLERRLNPSGSDPAERVISAEHMVAVRDMLARMLSALEVDVLALYVQGRSYREISAALGRHVKSIDNAIQRIKAKLETHLEARAEEGERAVA
jgi:RNA polymerase sporulation-specific sigma factor